MRKYVESEGYIKETEGECFLDSLNGVVRELLNAGCSRESIKVDVVTDDGDEWNFAKNYEISLCGEREETEDEVKVREAGEKFAMLAAEHKQEKDAERELDRKRVLYEKLKIELFGG